MYGFLNFSFSEAIGGMKFIFRMRVHMLKEAIKTLRSQKLKKAQI